MTSLLTAQPLAGYRGVLAEGPRHDSRTGELLWVDIPAGTVHRGRLTRGALNLTATYPVGGMVGALTPLADPGTGWIVAADDALCHLDEHGTVTVLTRPEAGRGTRFNDGACDPLGRFWIGSMHRPVRQGAGRLLRLETDGTVRAILDDVTISNGIGWSPDGTRAYFVDTATHRLDVLSLDADGEVTGRRPLITFPPGHGDPDGIDVDDDGCIWVALWDGWAVHRYSPEGDLLAVVHTPVSRPTACCFIDDTLVITTAADGLTQADLRTQPTAGQLLTVRVGVRAPQARPYRGPFSRTGRPDDHTCPEPAPDPAGAAAPRHPPRSRRPPPAARSPHTHRVRSALPGDHPPDAWQPRRHCRRT
ncbi:SMP-30/gluconolactonase/LRE family protein [Streptacidiphilus sp. PAMC 29251]